MADRPRDPARTRRLIDLLQKKADSTTYPDERDSLLAKIAELRLSIPAEEHVDRSFADLAARSKVTVTHDEAARFERNGFDVHNVRVTNNRITNSSGVFHGGGVTVHWQWDYGSIEGNP
jgi:hypothetical protein